MFFRKVSAQRHDLLDSLRRISAMTSVAELEPVLAQLYDADIRTLEECLLQVAHVCVSQQVKEVQEVLRGFMLWLAGRSLHVALRLSWMVDSMVSFYFAMGLGDRVKNIQDSVETYAINQVQSRPVSLCGSLATSTQPPLLRGLSPSPSSGNLDIDVDTSFALRKELRLKVFNDVRTFVTLLTEFSNTLRYYPDRNRRKEELRKRLRAVNEKLSTLRLVHPLGSSNDHVRWIVNIAVEECTVFSSRERAPYLIRYEVIVDDSATLQDPTASRLRLPDGRFKVSATSESLFEPVAVQVASADTPALSHVTPSEAFLRVAMGESNEERMARVRRDSPWGQHPNWSMAAMIVKAGDDLRQEELALQMIHIFDSIWAEAELTCRVHPYIALPTNADCGLLEVVDDSNSIDGIKKACHISSMEQFYSQAFGGENSPAFLEAQRNFVESMAGYSVISYILQIKDRHNGNLMITRSGQMVHIDFGFLFVTSPGGLNFESAPFKLSQELVDVMGGASSDMFKYYKVLVYQALNEARDRAEDLLALVSLMVPFNTMPCFGADPNAVVQQLQNRFRYDLPSDADYALYTKDLITVSTDNWRTRRYDQFQTLQNGIL